MPCPADAITGWPWPTAPGHGHGQHWVATAGYPSLWPAIASAGTLGPDLSRPQWHCAKLRLTTGPLVDLRPTSAARDRRHAKVLAGRILAQKVMLSGTLGHCAQSVGQNLGRMEKVLAKTLAHCAKRCWPRSEGRCLAWILRRRRTSSLTPKLSHF